MGATVEHDDDEPTASDEPGRHFVRSLERGLKVIEAFAVEKRPMTAVDVADSTGIPRAAVRRFLLTLTDLGYTRYDGRAFALTPRALQLGYSYLVSSPLSAVAQPHVEELLKRAQKALSKVSILDGGVAVRDQNEIAYVAYARGTSIFRLNISQGSRFPAWITSTGRVLLAVLDDDELEESLARTTLKSYTAATLRNCEELRSAILTARKQGWCVVDQEFEEKLTAFSVPLKDQNGRTVAALNLSTIHEPDRSPYESLLLEQMRATAARIEEDLRLVQP
ncbi:MAG: helix-turn-helix domain-containing protein [Pseudonocardiaceae bacterium]|nr:helix-turn-helix domain-containing protein [Pseudonocardiaceae bacterium]